MKKVLSLMLIVAMIFSMSTVALANETFEMTIYNAKDTHTYEAYQVFAGKVSGGKLVDITWGNGVDGDALLEDLNKVAAYAGCKNAEDVAAVLKNYADNSAALDAFAAIAGENLGTKAGDAVKGAVIKVEGKDVVPYTFKDLASGYYLVKDKDGSQTGHDAYTKYILSIVKLTDNLEIFSKSDFPSIDKNIELESKELVKVDDVSLGEKVNYLLSSRVPDMDGYDEYRFIATDVMSKGLTFNNDVELKIGDTTLDAGAFTVNHSTAADGKTTIVIRIANLKVYEKGADIEIRYSATVNQDAKIGTEGEINVVHLEYSNNPNFDYGGIPDDQDGPKGITPDSKTRVFTTAIELVKVDGKNNNTLTGAEFEIKGDSMKKVLVTEGVFEEDASGEYWRLEDGTYTKEDPGAENTTKYTLTTKTFIKDIAPTNVECRAFVNAEGKLVLEGLGAGTYTVKEIKAPAGYNLLKNDIVIEVGFTAPDPETAGCNWTFTVNGNVTNDTDGMLKFDVKNYSGLVLPSTGGMGTTLFYALGSILLVAAGVLIISKKRMAKK